MNLFLLILTLLLAALAAVLGVRLWMNRRAMHRLRRVAERMEGLVQQRLSTVDQQRNEMSAILSAMVEGVLAVDEDEHLLSINPAAARMLGVSPDRVIGQPVAAAARSTVLQQLVREALAGTDTSRVEATLRRPSTTGNGELTAGGGGGGGAVELQASASPLRDAKGQRIGAVLVLHDISELRRLEQVRRDFVANVSHEVKTPVSAILAAAETLLDDQRAERHTPPADAIRFLTMISRQAHRLEAIVDDLLSLARIEQAQAAPAPGESDLSGKSGVFPGALEPTPLRPLLEAAAETCRAKADERAMHLVIACPPEHAAKANAALLEQAVVNLIDNAVKYSPEGTRVDVRTVEHDGELVIEVADEGRGIEPRHLPRVFERFYRTDRARSRQLGGTGLGLSIVKHIAELHGGRVSVTSRVAAIHADRPPGSTFRIHLQPAAMESQTQTHETTKVTRDAKEISRSETA